MPDREDVSKGLRTSTGATPRQSGFFRTWIEVVLLVTGVVLLAVFAAAQVDRLLTSDALLEAFPVARPSAHATQWAGMAPEDPSIDSHGGTRAVENAQTLNAAGEAGLPLAVLRIPRIHVDVPVLDGTDVLTLNHAAGRIVGTALPGQAGNIGIAAHRDGFFRNLGKLRVGDPVELETRNGVETYVVEQTKIVMPDDISVLDPRPVPSLTLVTCYPFHYLGRAPQRYIVTASLQQPAAQVHPSANW
jgi:sortase A